MIDEIIKMHSKCQMSAILLYRKQFHHRNGYVFWVLRIQLSLRFLSLMMVTIAKSRTRCGDGISLSVSCKRV